MLGKNEKGKADVFAQIAQQGMNFGGKDLIVPTPPENNNVILPLYSDESGKRVYPDKMSTEEELLKELERQRKLYEPFMQNLAPSHRDYRKKIYLREFQHRLQTNDDEKDFLNVLLGKGQWNTVKIPHFGGPIGKHTAYYRTTFMLSDDDFENNAVFAYFKAVDYKAHIFINNSYIGSHEGFFAPFDFDITAKAHVGENTIVVICENDYVHSMGGDKIYAATGVGYDDPQVGWHHCPPGMGIYQDCYIETRPTVHIQDICVRPIIEENRAVCQYEVYNCGTESRELSYKISVYGQNFEETVFCDYLHKPTSVYECGLGDAPTIAERITNGTYNQGFALPTKKSINTFEFDFDIPNTKLWEPSAPYLYRIVIKIIDENGNEIDAMSRHFGMRSFTQDTECEGKKGSFYLNGKRIKLRGANTMGHEQQCVFKKDFDQLRDDILLAKICNMNFLRITQRPVETEVYDYLDMLGLMAQTDLPLFGCFRRNQFCEGIRQAEEMEHLVRSHPCCIIDSYINEPFPNANNSPNTCVNRKSLEKFFDACDIVIHEQNPDRVIKGVDGDYDPPSKYLPDNHCYPGWYNGHGIEMGKLYKGYWMPVKPGWYYGCGEYGSEGLDPACVMKKYYPKDWLPQNAEEEKTWTPVRIIRSQTGLFYYFFYEKPKSFDAWIDDSREHQRWATKIMTEAYRRNPDVITFAIHLFIDAFPSGWMKSIMDCERRPKPAYFAYSDALSPVMVSLRSDRHTLFSGEEASWEAWISNDGDAIENATLCYQVEKSDGTVLFSGKYKISSAELSSEIAGNIKFIAPDVSDREVFKITLGLFDENDTLIHYNTENITVFEPTPLLNGTATIIGDFGCKAQILAEDMGLTVSFDESLNKNSLILIDDYSKYLSCADKIEAAVADGAKAIFTELPNGNYTLFGSSFEVKACSMQPVNFVARDTGHKYVEGFDKKDFRNWYDKSCDYITPILDNTLFTDDFVPILTSGNTDNSKTWNTAIAACEKAYGNGFVAICNVKLSGRTNENPVAQRFAKKLLTL